jgi:hypothetical protein
MTIKLNLSLQALVRIFWLRSLWSAAHGFVVSARGRPRQEGLKVPDRFSVQLSAQRFSAHEEDDIMMTTIQSSPLLSSSMAEHPAVNRRVVGSSPT